MTKTRTVRGEKRAVAGRREILDAARAIGVREGWSAVTIRAVASGLGYTSPLLYEHFKDKEDLLTQLAVDSLAQLESTLTADLPEGSRVAVETTMQRYWKFMLDHPQLYRLINGMDGTPLNREVVGKSAWSLCKSLAAILRPVAGKDATEETAMRLTEELWALLHGMCALHLDRSVPFDMRRVTEAGFRLIAGASQ